MKCADCKHWDSFQHEQWAHRYGPDPNLYGECLRFRNADDTDLFMPGANQGCTDPEGLWTHLDFGCVLFEVKP